MARLLDDVRIAAAPELVDNLEAETIKERSHDSSMVFLPFRIRAIRLAGPFEGSLDRVLPYIPITALVRAAEDIDLSAEPEKGKAGELAAALDALERAEERSKKLEKESARAARLAEEMKRGAEMGSPGSGDCVGGNGGGTSGDKSKDGQGGPAGGESGGGAADGQSDGADSRAAGQLNPFMCLA